MKVPDLSMQTHKIPGYSHRRRVFRDPLHCLPGFGLSCARKWQVWWFEERPLVIEEFISPEGSISSHRRELINKWMCARGTRTAFNSP